MFKQLMKSTSIGLLVLSLISCGNVSDNDNNSIGSELTGSFIDSSVEGLRYETATFNGETDKEGHFKYLFGENIRFYIGNLFLGEAEGKSLVTPYSLYPNNTKAAITVARLLQTIDADKDPSNGIALVNQEIFDNFDKALTPENNNFESELSLIQTLDVSAVDAQRHLDSSLGIVDTSAPIFTSSNEISVNENQTSVLTLVAVDTHSAVLYSLTGTDVASFNLNPSSGLLTFKNAPDYETKKTYTISAKASDSSGNFVMQIIEILILDVNDRTNIRTVDLISLASAQAQTPVAYLTSQFEQKDKISYVDGDQNIFITKGVKYATDTWASQFNFTGVAWDGVLAGTLITDQHIVLAAHYARNVGDTLKFLNSDGITEERTLIARKYLRNYDADLGDAWIGKLNAPVSEKVRVYPILKSDITDDLSSLNGAPYIMTDKNAKAFPEKILALRYEGNVNANVYDVVNWGKNSKYLDFMYHSATNGDSGNPHFLYMNGELVLGSVLYGYGTGGMVSHFYGFASIQDALSKAILDMKGE